MGFSTHPGRILHGLRGCGRGGGGARQHRQPDQRVGHPARGFLRRRRLQAVVWPPFNRRRPLVQPDARSRRRVRPYRRGGRSAGCGDGGRPPRKVAAPGGMGWGEGRAEAGRGQDSRLGLGRTGDHIAVRRDTEDARRGWRPGRDPGPAFRARRCDSRSPDDHGRGSGDLPRASSASAPRAAQPGRPGAARRGVANVGRLICRGRARPRADDPVLR
jgi:hypothetical protein